MPGGDAALRAALQPIAAYGSGYTGVCAMTDPLSKATSTPPPTLGEGCLSRYDPQALSPEDGTDFADARTLWLTLNPPLPAEPDTPSEPFSGKSGA